MADALRDTTQDLLRRRLIEEQRDRRLPSLVAGVVRDGALVWTGSAGEVDGAAPTDDHQYRIGSITKPMTAVAVMRLRDEGLVELNAPITDYLPDAPAGVTVAQLLSHSAGLQSESNELWWERVPGDGWDELVQTSLSPDAVRHTPGERFHYSNLGFGVLGELVARLRGKPWDEVLHEELFVPLGMTRTTPRPVAPNAQGYSVHPHADVLLPQPEHDGGAMAAAGQMWCSIVDLARWATFIAGDTADVISEDTLTEMLRPRAVQDVDGAPWQMALGLGFQVWNIDGKRYAGHGGSMPGFVALCRTSLDTGVGVVVMANTTSGLTGELLTDVQAILDTHEPATEPEPWSPAEVSDELLELTGPWYWGPRPYTLTVQGSDTISLDPNGSGRASRFVRDPERDAWIGLDDYYAGETLRVVRRDDGTVSHLDLSTFIFTRTPYDEDAPIPGGVDERGWTPAR